MKYNTRATLGNEIKAMQGWQNADTVKGILKGLTAGADSGAKLRIGSQRARNFTNRAGEQLDILRDRFANTTDPEAQAQLQQEMSRLAMMSDQVTPFNVDDVMKQYFDQYEKYTDPRKLANEIRKAEIAGKARVDAAGQIAYGMMNRPVTGLQFSLADPQGGSSPQGALDVIKNKLGIGVQNQNYNPEDLLLKMMENLGYR
jgi:hypothetical protein